MADHQYWRVVITANESGSNFSCAELELRDSNGTNVAAGCTPLASSVYQDNATYGADKAFDGNTTTQWVSNGTAGRQYLGCQLAAGADVVAVAWRARASSTFSRESPRRIYVQYSDDGTTWSNAWSQIDTSAWTSGLQKVWTKPSIDPEASHAYWRLVVLDVTSTTYCAIQELEFRASIGGANQCSGGTASASTALYPASYAFDGDKTTNTHQWATTSGATSIATAWLQYAFASAVSVRQIEVTAINADPTQTPTRFAIECSDDGLAFLAYWNVQTDAWGSGYESRTFSPPASYSDSASFTTDSTFDVTDEFQSGTAAETASLVVGSEFAVNDARFHPFIESITPSHGVGGITVDIMVKVLED